MRPNFVGEETGAVFGTKVEYLSGAERQAFKVTAKDGKLYTAEGVLLDTTKAKTLHGSGGGIYVMDANGNVYIAARHSRGRFHHSSFLAGKPVAAADEIMVEDGVVTWISAQSGHYRPGPSLFSQVLTELKRHGIVPRAVKKL